MNISAHVKAFAILFLMGEPFLSTNDWGIDPANDLVYSLKTGGQKRE